jgi:hypothetical protein
VQIGRNSGQSKREGHEDDITTGPWDEARSEQIANNQHGINSHGHLEAFGICGHFSSFFRVQLDKTLHVDRETVMSCVGFWLLLEPLECFDATGKTRV